MLLYSGGRRITAGGAVGGVVDAELSVWTSTAATTVVQLLATAAWEQARSAVGGLWRRVHPAPGAGCSAGRG
jgi:hypothetical protein